MASAPAYELALAIRCVPSCVYQATTASESCAFQAAAQPSASSRVTRSSRTAAVAGRDEHDLALGQTHALTLGRAPDEDLAPLHAVDAGLVVDPLVQRCGPEHLHRQRARVAGDARRRLRRAEQGVERGWHEAAVQA